VALALGQRLARHRRNRVVRKVMSRLLALHRGYENLSYDFHTNGEARVLRSISRGSPVRTVFDVGANTGAWATMAAQTFEAAEIHSFEIVPATAAVFRANAHRLERIVVNDVGLSDREGGDEVHLTAPASPIATCVPDFTHGFHKLATATVAVTTTTGDLYCQRHGIDSIDFLKIDVEGYEHKVLAGFSTMLERQAIRAIQFEYGYVNIATRFLLKDFYDLLVPLGMVIGKIYPDHVDFRPYDYRHEDFLGPNFLAVRAAELPLLSELRAVQVSML
jgi:FkbM family methyltransferase